MTPASDPRVEAFARLLATVDRFRGEGGCAWFEAQTGVSLVPYLQEETAELIDAIEAGSSADRREELGDVLFQVLFHADIASAAGEFDLADIAEDQRAKLLRRNPHVFGATPSRDIEEIIAMWREQKAIEKAGRASVLDGIAFGMPALALAQKVIGRGSEVLGELDEPPASEKPGRSKAVSPSAPLTEEALGEALFALVAEASAAGLDAERALRTQVRHYAACVRAVEQRSGAQPVGEEPAEPTKRSGNSAHVDEPAADVTARPCSGAPRAKDTMS